MQVQSLNELILQNIIAPKEVISHGLLYHQTKLVLFGAPKIYKSLLAQQMAFNIASGTPWIGFHTSLSKVLYVQSEIAKIPFRLRVIKMAQNQPVAADHLYFASEFGLRMDREQGRVELVHAIEKVRPQVVILDPFYKLLSTPDEPAIARAIDNLDYIIDSQKVSIVLVHHSRKARISSSGFVVDFGAAELRGPLLEPWADSIIRIKGDISTDLRTLDFECRNATTILSPVDIALDRQRLWFTRI